MQQFQFKIYIVILIFNLFFIGATQSVHAYFEVGPALRTEKIIEDTTKVKSINSGKSDSLSVDSVKVEKKWKMKNTYVGGSVSWKNHEGTKESDYELRFGSSLTGRRDKIDLKLESQYKSKKEGIDDNEQYARINWYHTFYRQFYVLGQGRVERDQLTLEGTRFDYILLQEGIGPGYNLKLEKSGESRVSILYNFFQVEIFKYNIPFHQQAFSLYLDNYYDISRKINLSNWTNIFFWDNNNIGFDIETEILYKLMRNLGLGVRHTYFFNGPTLQKLQSSELKIFIKITF
jgi:hypothetical protein